MYKHQHRTTGQTTVMKEILTKALIFSYYGGCLPADQVNIAAAQRIIDTNVEVTKISPGSTKCRANVGGSSPGNRLKHGGACQWCPWCEGVWRRGVQK